MASTLKVNIVGDAKKFTKATKTAESSLQKLGKAGISSARMLKGALGAAGLAIGFSALTSQLQNATKAAVEDAKSQALLERQLTNTVGATKLQTAAVEDAITKMSLLSAVPDDEIRPAFAQLLRSTKSVTKATKLTSLALDVAAGTGKDVGTVAKALSKAYGGNTGALSKMGINVKKGGNWMKELKTQFKGMADVQARQDPIKRLKTTFDELQEKLGKGFIPLLNKVADWFNENYDKIAKFFTDAWNSKEIGQVKDALKFVWEQVLVPLGEWATSKDVKEALQKIWDAMSRLVSKIGEFISSDAGTKLAELGGIAVITALTLLKDTINAVSDAIDRLNGKQITRSVMEGYTAYGTVTEGNTGGTTFDKGGSAWANSRYGVPITNNITIYANKLDPKAVVAEIDKWSRSKGRGPIVFGG